MPFARKRKGNKMAPWVCDLFIVVGVVIFDFWAATPPAAAAGAPACDSAVLVLPFLLVRGGGATWGGAEADAGEASEGRPRLEPPDLGVLSTAAAPPVLAEPAAVSAVAGEALLNF